MLPSRAKMSSVKYLCLCLIVLGSSISGVVHSRGGGSKRTFGSPKSQNSPNQQAVDCSDQQQQQQQQQQPCANHEHSDPSWSSAFGATMALIGPLLVLLTFIIMIKFCFYNSYPEGQPIGEQHQEEEQQGNKDQQLEFGSGFLEICTQSLDDGSGKHINNNNHHQHDDKQVAYAEGARCCCVAVVGGGGVRDALNDQPDGAHSFHAAEGDKSGSGSSCCDINIPMSTTCKNA